jgi:hypothetical protein
VSFALAPKPAAVPWSLCDLLTRFFWGGEFSLSVLSWALSGFSRTSGGGSSGMRWVRDMMMVFLRRDSSFHSSTSFFRAASSLVSVSI